MFFCLIPYVFCCYYIFSFSYKYKQMKSEKLKQHEEKEEDAKHGGRLSEETINYFKRVEQMLLENTFDDDDHKETFLRNVCHQIETDGSQLTRHTLTSKIIERIVPLLSHQQYRQLLCVVQPDLNALCTNRFASHVIETLCKCNQMHFEDVETQKLFCRACKVIRNNASAYMRDVYGSHVISTIAQVCGGVIVPDQLTRSRSCRQADKKHKRKTLDPNGSSTSIQPPKRLAKAFKKLFTKVISDDNFGELLCHRTASPVLQVLLHVTKGNEDWKELFELIVGRAGIVNNVEEEDEDEVNTSLPVVMTDEVGTHLLEAVVQTSGKEMVGELGKRCFNRLFVSLCVHPLANFLAQSYMRQLNNAEQAEPAINKLVHHLEDILATGHMGCVVRGAETIAKLKMVDKQKTFLLALSGALHIPPDDAKKSFAKLILSLMTFDVYYEKDDRRSLVQSDVNYHGACLLKHCLEFKKSRQVVDSLLALTGDEIITIGSHPNGSFTIQAFLASDCITVKKKASLINQVTESVVSLVCDRYGSFVFDSIWKCSDEEQRQQIREVLKQHMKRIEKNSFGKICLYNAGMSQPKIDHSRQNNKRKHLTGIVGDTQTVGVKKEKKTKTDDRASKYREQLKALGISLT